MKHIFPFVAALSLAACATAPIAGSPVRQDGLARIGDTGGGVVAQALSASAAARENMCFIGRLLLLR